MRMKKMNRALELISDYKELDTQIGILFQEAYDAGYRVGWGNIQPQLKKIGKYEEYRAIYSEQDVILKKLGIQRFWEDFGLDSTSEVIDMIETVIRKFMVSEDE